MNPGDVVLADTEGIVVVPRAKADDRANTQARQEADAKLTLDQWEVP